MSDSALSRGESLFLDLVRILASQAVVVGHGISYFAVPTYYRPPNMPWMQNIAVVVFFVLSGFIITHSTQTKLSQENYNFRAYFADRASRIFTAFIPALLFVAVLDDYSRSLDSAHYGYASAYNLHTFVANLFMLQDYPYNVFGGITSFGSARPFWTIAIEWWIYLIFGWSFLIAQGREHLTLRTVFFTAMCVVLPYYHFWGGRGNGLGLMWIFGMVVCLATVWTRDLTIPRGLLWLFTVLLLGAMYGRQLQVNEAYDKVFALLMAGFFLVALWLARGVPVSDSVLRVARYLASYSFTLYLVHYSILDFLNVHVRGTNAWSSYELLWFAFCICNLVAWAIGRVVEVRGTPMVRRLLRRILITTPSTHHPQPDSAQ